MPCDGTAETKVSPAGSWSVTWTPVAFEGPRLLAVIVNVTFDPTTQLLPFADLATAMSASDAMLVGSLAVSFAVLTSLPPDTVAELVTHTGALCRTVTVMTIAG